MATIDTGDWEVRAWEGVLVEVPAQWDIAAISGERKKGYLRIDDQEAMPRVEIKWQQSKGFVNVGEVIENYLKDLGKKKSPGEAELDVNRNASVVSNRQMKKRDLTCFSWQGEISGYGAGWYCPECERVVVVQVMARAEEDGKALAAAIISSVRDHPEDGWVTWSTYGLYVETPERFDLSDQKLMAGLIELRFTDKGEEIVAARWGMANVALGDGGLTQWAARELRQFHKGVKLAFEETEFRGHPGVLVSGVFANPLKHIQSFLMHVMGKPYPETVSGWAWLSEDENRLYYIGTLLDEVNAETAEEVALRVACPEGDGGEEDHSGEPIR